MKAKAIICASIILTMGIVLLMIYALTNENGNINVYGRVVDVSGAPVRNATVKAIITRQKLFRVSNKYIDRGQSPDYETEQVVLQSDASGRFSVAGMRGTAFNVCEINGRLQRKIGLWPAFFFGTKRGANIPRSDDPRCPVVFILPDENPGD